MSDQVREMSNDDFEKVDPEPFQDENVTSTSMTGDMAEEDRYPEESTAQNDVDLLGGVSERITTDFSDPKATPLISFDGTPEPSAPPLPGELSVPGAKADAAEGNWVNNVDPRDEPLIEDMAKHIEAQTPELTESQAQSEASLSPYTRVLELIYWRDVKKTGVVFGSMMFILLSLSICSLMSVLAYLSLAVLTVTLSFRVYKSVMQAVQKTNEGHPFKPLLQMDIELREDVVQNAADKIAKNINNCVKELRRLYLVDDYIDSLKFGLLLWLLTYIGAWFDGMTLVILAVISIFTLPKVYETYKVPIDQNVNLIRANLNNIMAQISAKIPLIKKKAKTQ